MQGTGHLAQEDPDRLSHQFHSLSFLPPLIILNTLPCTLNARLIHRNSTSPAEDISVDPGDSTEICSFNVSREKTVTLEVTPPGANVSSTVVLHKRHRAEEQLCATIEACGSGNGASAQFRALFSVTVDKQCGQMTIEVSSPCWLMNKSGLPVEVATKHPTILLQSKAEDVVHCLSTRSRPPCATELDAPVLLGQARVLPLQL
jgi:hypothetical protein